ncbi:MAG: glycoside hydrolase family 3 C-terminal domain-containing protein [Candidatus Enteromonas sp.]|nr:glycoside hydrolase family 3 C-terminal domain-containing protein [Candidatus Enteromonas sp.]
MKRRNQEELMIGEKVRLLHGDGQWHIRGVRRLKIPGIEMHDGPFGVRKVGEKEKDVYAAEEATCFPSPACLACSWDEDLEHRIGEAMGKEASARGTSLLLTPGVNIKRSPLCGRNFEYLSEDPLLSGKMGAGFVRGIQSVNVGGCVKHYACNSQESYRNISDSIVDERALHEIYLKPFEIVVKESNPWALMTSYNLINGKHASEHDELLKDVLRSSWHYEGVVMSDWGGTFDPITSHNHGLDLEMPCNVKKRSATLRRALRRGYLDSKAVDDSSSRVLQMLQKAKKGAKKETDESSHHALAKEAAAKSIVLLRNEESLLPLASLRDCCVIGAFAKSPRYQGNGSSFVKSSKVVSFLDATKAFNLPYAQGYSLEQGEDDANLVYEAVDLASKSKTVLLFLGLPSQIESEGFDRETINLPNNQLSLFDAIYQSNPNIVVILSCGAPVALPFVHETKAILCDYLAGEAGAEALVDLLLGKIVPSGKLAETWPLHLADTPCFGFYPGYEGQAIYKESIYVGYRYYISCEKPVLFPFGHGLSYCKLSYSMTLSSSTLKEKEIVMASVKVANANRRPCEVVVELYAETTQKDVFRPRRVLIAFKKIAVEPRKSAVVDFPLTLETFAHYDVEEHRFRTEGGTYHIQVGESCADIVCEESLEVKTEATFVSLRHPAPIYYSVPYEGFGQYDDEFESLLGRVVPLPADRHERPFNMDSTMEEIAWTPIGKLIRKVFYSHAFDGHETEGQKAFLIACFENNPIRSLSVGGLSPRLVAMVLDFANGNYFLGIIHLLFGKRPSRK